MSWAKIVDCGDVRMTPLDNTIALKQLDKAHQVSIELSLPMNFLLMPVLDSLWTTSIDSIQRPHSSHRCSWWGPYYHALSTPVDIR
jgi:hypothetical protein